jgi:purine-binding chemotaxis protein CheW
MSKQYCTFRLGQHLFGIDVLRVQEIIRHLRTTRVPLAPPVVIGLINLRGQLVTAIDLRRRLELPPREGGHAPINVVVTGDDGAAALQVDEIGDVLDVDESTFEPTPDTVQGVVRDLLVGVHKLKDHLLLVLDTQRVINLSMSTQHA